MSDTHVEIEDTFDVDDAFVVPPLSAFVPAGGRTETVTSRLRSTYLDTPERTLLAARVTLRRRDGDDDRGWHLKVPAGTARTEIHRPLGAGPGEPVPEALARLVRGLVDVTALAPTAVVATTRTRHRILAATGEVVLEVDDDVVEATPAGGTTLRWREVEIELGTGSTGLLAQVGRAVAGAGGRPAAVTSKLARALATGPAPTEPPAAAGLHAYLAEQVDAMVAGDVDLRRGQDPVHAVRVATRRIRSTLRVFDGLVERERAAWLDGELRWWSAVLGAARDAQVQRARHRASLDALAPELVLGPVRARIDQDTTAAEARARERIAEVQDGERYRALLAELLRWRAAPPFTATAGGGRGVLRDAARRASRRAERRLRQGLATGDDERLHRARKAAKRARYAQDLLRSVERGDRRRTAKAAAKRHQRVQTVLGDHQDAAVAADLLRRLGAAAGARGENGFTFGVLWQREQQRADDARRAANTLLR